MWRRVILFAGIALTSGCSYNMRQAIHQTKDNLARHPYDVVPAQVPDHPKPRPTPESSDAGSSSENAAPVTASQTDALTTAWMEPRSRRADRDESLADDAVEPVAWKQSPVDTSDRAGAQRRLELNIPPQLPGSEAPLVELSRESTTLEREINRIYPELAPLPAEPVVEPGPEGRPYTLSDLQRLAAENSPILIQAIADVETARGILVQARTYPNPTVGYVFDANNNNTAANTQGGFVNQTIRTTGKQKLGVAAAQQDLDIAELALKRARSDLATAVRNAYFTLLVDVETLAVTRALAQFTDDMYRLHTGLLKGALAAPYEPASLRAQAFNTRLAYKQAIASYIYDWKQLVATIGLHQLPLTEIAGKVDRLIPYYEYDQVLTYTLQNHTDILTAQHILNKAQYNLKLAQLTPIPDMSVRAAWERDKSAFPFGMYHTLSISFPLAVWDQNTGGIIAAQSALARATEESHRVEVTLTNNLAAAYANYQNNLFAIEYYRRDILPDLVRYYRGIHARRQIDPNSQFGDLVVAQQNLSTNAMSYLGVLQNLWMSAVNVADFLQTDDLFQLAKTREVPELPDFNQLSPQSDQ